MNQKTFKYCQSLFIYIFFQAMFRLLPIIICFFLYTPLTLGQSPPLSHSYYVLDGTCCGGEDSDPHAVFGIEASDGYILLGKSIDSGGSENAFAVKLSKNYQKRNYSFILKKRKASSGLLFLVKQISETDLILLLY